MNKTTINVHETVNRNLLNAMHSIFEASAQRANNRIGSTETERRDRVVRSDGGYKCIHLDPIYFISMLGDVLQHQKILAENMYGMKFLDIGCGVGEKIYLASLFGLDCYGLELREELINEGKNILQSMGHGGYNSFYGLRPKEPSCFIHADALTYDYKDFDILYFYCPLCDGNLQVKLEEQIAKTAKVGAIVFTGGSRGCFSYADDTLPANWKKIITGHNGNTRYFIREA